MARENQCKISMLCSLGKAIKVLRLSQRTTQQQLASIAQVSQDYVVRVENGVQLPSKEFLQAIVDASVCTHQSLWCLAERLLVEDPGHDKAVEGFIECLQHETLGNSPHSIQQLKSLFKYGLLDKLIQLRASMSSEVKSKRNQEIAQRIQELVREIPFGSVSEFQLLAYLLADLVGRAASKTCDYQMTLDPEDLSNQS